MLDEVLALLRSMEDIPQPDQVLPPSSPFPQTGEESPSELGPAWLADFDALLQQSVFSDLALPIPDASEAEQLLQSLLNQEIAEANEAAVGQKPEVPAVPLEPPPLDNRLVLEPGGPDCVLENALPCESVSHSSQKSAETIDSSDTTLLRSVANCDLLESTATPLPSELDVVQLGQPYLLFGLAGSEYAVALAQVREICNPPAVTPIPRVPRWLCGVSQVRGDILSVVDLRAFLGLPPTRALTRPRLLVVHNALERFTAGLLVDGTRAICKFPDDRITPLDSPIEPLVHRYLIGQVQHASRILGVLDLERVLQSPEMRFPSPIRHGP
jgi:chemotaxis signal transduction protein